MQKNVLVREVVVGDRLVVGRSLLPVTRVDNGNPTRLYTEGRVFSVRDGAMIQIKRSDASDAAKSGTMAALVPPKHIAKALTDVAGEDLEDSLHLTLAYTGTTSEVDQEALWAGVHEFSLVHGPINASLRGWDAFGPDDDGDYALVALVDLHDGDHMRADLVAHLLDQGLSVSDKYPFNPHITVKYSPKEPSQYPVLPDVGRWTFDSVVASYGDRWQDFTLIGDRSLRADAPDPEPEPENAVV